MVGASPPLSSAADKACSTPGVAILLLYTTVPENGAQSVTGPGMPCSNGYKKVRGEYNSGVITE